jgi:hypothetical protein
LNTIEIFDNAIAEAYLSEAPTLKALIDKSPKAKHEFIKILKSVRDAATEV